MPTEIVVRLENKPGTLADLSETLGGAGVNVQLMGMAIGNEGIARFVADDPDRAVEALLEAGFTITQVKEALEITLPDIPGSLGQIARRLANAGVNLEAWYIVGASPSGLSCVVVPDSLDAAKAVI